MNDNTRAVTRSHRTWIVVVAAACAMLWLLVAPRMSDAANADAVKAPDSRASSGAWHRCGKVTVDRRPRLTLAGVQVKGASCEVAARLLRREQRSQEQRGKNIPRDAMTCRAHGPTARLHCKQQRITIRFWPDCDGHDCDT